MRHIQENRTVRRGWLFPVLLTAVIASPTGKVLDKCALAGEVPQDQGERVEELAATVALAELTSDPASVLLNYRHVIEAARRAQGRANIGYLREVFGESGGWYLQSGFPCAAVITGRLSQCIRQVADCSLRRDALNALEEFIREVLTSEDPPFEPELALTFFTYSVYFYSHPQVVPSYGNDRVIAVLEDCISCADQALQNTARRLLLGVAFTDVSRRAQVFSLFRTTLPHAEAEELTQRLSWRISRFPDDDRVTEEDYFALQGATASELAAIVRTGKVDHNALARYGLELLAGSRTDRVNNFEHLLGLAREGVMPQEVVLALAEPANSSATVSEKRQVDRLLDFLAQEIDESYESSYSATWAIQALRRVVCGRSTRVDLRNRPHTAVGQHPPHGSERVIQLLCNVLQAGGTALRREAADALADVSWAHPLTADAVLACLQDARRDQGGTERPDAESPDLISGSLESDLHYELWRGSLRETLREAENARAAFAARADEAE